jgi:hypothetical protein
MTLFRLLLLPVLLMLTLTACQPVDNPLLKSSSDDIKTVSEDATEQEAIAQYLSLAAKSNGEKQAIYQLRAAKLLWQTGDIERSENTLKQININLLKRDDLQQALMLQADIAFYHQDGDAALAALDQVELDRLSITGRKKVLQLKSDAYTLTENWLGKATTLLELMPLLEPSEQADYQQTLWSALMQMTPEALDLYNPGFPPQIDSGWFALAHLIKAYQSKPEILQVALEDWLRSYPHHPANPNLYEDVLNAGTQLPDDLEHIAVLLPASGPFVNAAKVIKQGIVAAHYASGSTARLHFLDIHSDSNGYSDVLRQYAAAVDLGARIVIGPLEKQAVDELSTYGDLSIPVLALNRIDERLSRPNLYQFGLAPEDDVKTIAELARKQGFQRALLLSPDSEWGTRLADAFNTAWQAEGGKVVGQARYDEQAHDFKASLVPLMGLDRSEQRYQVMKSLIGESMEFEPRRRQDVDFLFLIARPLKARQIVPQLKFHRSGKLPLFATSHAYSGQIDTQQDIDLNQLIIADIPWMFAQDTPSDPAYQGMLAANNQSVSRLYAMGVDAYRLIPALNTLSRDDTLSIEGATGRLSINSLGQVERIMSAGQFEQGQLEPLK